MSLYHPNEPENEYTEGEQQHSLIGRRMEAFANRSRQPGDATTWEIVLAALMCTLLIVCYSVADRPLFALGTLIILLAWITYTFVVGKVNVFSVLWGSSTTDAHLNPNHMAILRSTALIAIVSLVSVIVDAATGWGFGYYGIALLLVIIFYVGVVYRTWIAPVTK